MALAGTSVIFCSTLAVLWPTCTNSNFRRQSIDYNLRSSPQESKYPPRWKKNGDCNVYRALMYLAKKPKLKLLLIPASARYPPPPAYRQIHFEIPDNSVSNDAVKIASLRISPQRTSRPSSPVKNSAPSSRASSPVKPSWASSKGHACPFLPSNFDSHGHAKEPFLPRKFYIAPLPAAWLTCLSSVPAHISGHGAVHAISIVSSIST